MAGEILVVVQVARPQTGLINRYRAVIALIMAHPNLVTANFEALSVIEMADQRLEQLKKAVIDAVIRDPDLDVAALNYHLQSLDFTGVVEELSGDEMKSRLPFDPHELAPDRAAAHLEELLGLVEGKSGLFSKVRLST